MSIHAKAFLASANELKGKFKQKAKSDRLLCPATSIQRGSSVIIRTGNFNDVAGDNILGTDLLHTILVRTDNLAHFRLVFLEGFNSGFSIAFLKMETISK